MRFSVAIAHDSLIRQQLFQGEAHNGRDSAAKQHAASLEPVSEGYYESPALHDAVGERTHS